MEYFPSVSKFSPNWFYQNYKASANYTISYVDTPAKISKNDLMSMTIKNLGDGIIVFSMSTGKVLLANEMAEEILGMKPISSTDIWHSASHFFIKDGTDDPYPVSDFPVTLGRMGNTAFCDDLVLRRKGLKDIHIEMKCKPILSDAGKMEMCLINFNDITTRKRHEKHIKKCALYDALTELPNRLLFNEMLEHEIANSRRIKCHSAVLFMDMDRFKVLNDTHGHHAGDLLLREVAHRTKQCVREMDTVARFGGDEFAVLLGNLSSNNYIALQNAFNIVSKITIALSKPYYLLMPDESVVEHHCSVSIGVKLFGYNTDLTIEELICQADDAMYKAKQDNKNAQNIR